MELEELRRRYTTDQRQAIDGYFQMLARTTRKAGKIALSVVVREMEYWSRFPPEVVVAALVIHTSKYPGKREAYTRGIMRELARERGGAGGKPGGDHPARGGYGRGKYRGHYLDGSDEGGLPF